jgi:hypothetical protein
VAFIGYRDHCSTAEDRFAIKKFTESIDEVKKFIANVKAKDGGDTPEDVTGGMR